MIRPDYFDNARDLASCLSEANLFQCLSCNACRSRCSIHTATNRLRPLEVVRLASLGMLQRALVARELWYCLQCNRCTQMCPVTVKPSVLIRSLRREAIQRGLIDLHAIERYEAVCKGFQRARWHGIAQCISGTSPHAIAADYDRWAATPVESSAATIPLPVPSSTGLREALDSRLGFATDLSACMTCGECTSSCPVTHERAVYDPVWIFRMVNLGLTDELLRSPSLWMCLGCGACTQACAQGVRGHLVLRALQELAVERGVVPEDMSRRLWACEHALYPRFLAEVDGD